MEILKNSWHYKLWLFRHRKRSENNILGLTDRLNLCRYFWTIVFMPLLLMCPLFLSGVMAVFGFSYDTDCEEWEPVRPKQGIATGVALWAAIIYLPLIWFNKATEIISLTILLASLVVALAVLVTALIVYAKDRISEHPGAISLVGEYRKAVKSKICPTIKVV